MKQSKISSVSLALCLFFFVAYVSAQTNRGAGNVRVKNDAGKVEEVKLYEGSYALVIGISDYTNGWKSLKGVKEDVTAIETVLIKQGFTVKTVLNPTGEQVQAALDNFVRNYGYTFGNRLLFYYAGHGDMQVSDDGRKIGYVVPSDAPLPSKNLALFRQTAISMNDFEYYAHRIQAKHALFVFDSCFSGTMLTTTRSKVPPIINFKTTQPVRQFITAGSEDQEVPDISEFRKQFVEGLDGEADLNQDGYITGSELADFLQTNVSNYTREAQTPQYGKIRDGRLDKGDFVFTVLRNDIVTVAVPNAEIELIHFKDVNKKYGYKDATGRVVIAPTYDEANAFSQGLAAVKLGSKYGFINKTGELVIPFKFNLAWSFSDDLALVEYADNQEGFINFQGKVVIPLRYEYAGMFSEGLAWVSDHKGKYGFIDKTGKIVIPLQYDDVNPFNNGKAQVKLDSRSFYIDKKGNEIR